MLKKTALLVMLLGLGAAPIAWAQDDSHDGDEMHTSDESDDVDSDIDDQEGALDESVDLENAQGADENMAEGDDESANDMPEDAEDDFFDLTGAHEPTDESSEAAEPSAQEALSEVQPAAAAPVSPSSPAAPLVPVAQPPAANPPPVVSAPLNAPPTTPAGVGVTGGVTLPSPQCPTGETVIRGSHMAAFKAKCPAFVCRDSNDFGIYYCKPS